MSRVPSSLKSSQLRADKCHAFCHCRLSISTIVNTLLRVNTRSLLSSEVQVNLCQKLLFLHQLSHNMTTHCSLNYKFNTWKFQAQTWGEHVGYWNCFWHSEQFLYAQHVLPMFSKKKSFWQRFTCTEAYAPVANRRPQSVRSSPWDAFELEKQKFRNPKIPGIFCSACSLDFILNIS